MNLRYARSEACRSVAKKMRGNFFFAFLLKSATILSSLLWVWDSLNRNLFISEVHIHATARLDRFSTEIEQQPGQENRCVEPCHAIRDLGEERCHCRLQTSIRIAQEYPLHEEAHDYAERSNNGDDGNTGDTPPHRRCFKNRPRPIGHELRRNRGQTEGQNEPKDADECSKVRRVDINCQRDNRGNTHHHQTENWRMIRG